MWTIYKITNKINGKIYVGQTYRTPEERWDDHRREAWRHTTPMARAIVKYGWDNFQPEVIDTAITQKEANEKERYWIAYYQTCIGAYGDDAKGYNLTPGGDGVPKITPDEDKYIYDLWQKNYYMKDIGKLINRDEITVKRALLRMGITQEEIHSRHSYVYRTVYVYNLKGELINTFPSLKDAVLAYPNISRGSISQVIRHIAVSTHQLIFLYEDELDKLQEHLDRSKKRHYGGVKSVNIITQEEQRFESVVAAGKAFKVHPKTIRYRIKMGIIKDNIRLEYLDNKTPQECTVEQIR